MCLLRVRYEEEGRMKNKANTLIKRLSRKFEVSSNAFSIKTSTHAPTIRHKRATATTTTAATKLRWNKRGKNNHSHLIKRCVTTHSAQRNETLKQFYTPNAHNVYNRHMHNAKNQIDIPTIDLRNIKTYKTTTTTREIKKKQIYAIF